MATLLVSVPLRISWYVLFLEILLEGSVNKNGSHYAVTSGMWFPGIVNITYAWYHNMFVGKVCKVAIFAELCKAVEDANSATV